MKILITGGNRGIGYAIVEHLLQSPKVSSITITSRKLESGIKAIESLQPKNKNKIEMNNRELDLSEDSSLDKLVSELTADKVQYDVICQNGGVSFNQNAEDLVKEKDYVFKVNYFSTIKLSKMMAEQNILKKGGRMVFTSSTAGHFKYFNKNKEAVEIMSQYKSPDFTEETLNNIVTAFYNESMDPKFEGKWPKRVYGVSKLFLSIRIYLLSRLYKDYKWYAYCPGFCLTDMTKHLEPYLTAYEGANTARYLILDDLEEDKNGLFFFESKVREL